MQSTTIIAFDQHAATTVAAVLLPGHRTPALHTLTSDSATIVRFVERVQRKDRSSAATKRGRVASNSSGRSAAARWPAT
jgi:hypothetical protein